MRRWCLKTNYIELWQQYHDGDHLCESYMNLELWFRGYRLKKFLILALMAILFSGEERLYNLPEDVMRKISAKHFEFGLVVV